MNLEDIHNNSLQEFRQKANLTEEELGWLTSTKSLQEVLDIVREAQKAKQTRSRKPILRFVEWLGEEIVAKLDKFSAVIDMMTSSDPAISGLVWGGLKVVLMVSELFRVTLTMPRYTATLKKHSSYCFRLPWTWPTCCRLSQST